MADNQSSNLAKRLTQRARDLRRLQTIPEALLWSRLRAGQIGRFKFRRQYPIGLYVADFCCIEAKLIIELDGDSHADQITYDAQRTDYLVDLGYKVLRFTNRDVVNNIEGVIEYLLSECERRSCL